QEVGQALIDYLRNDRPKNSPHREIFLTYTAPFLPLQDSSAVGSNVRRHMKRAGIAPSVSGAHLFRHTAATRWCDVARVSSISLRLLRGGIDLGIADGAGVNNLAVFGDGEAPHCLVLFGEPVKKLVEFGFVQRLGVACASALRKVLFVFQNISRL